MSTVTDVILLAGTGDTGVEAVQKWLTTFTTHNKALTNVKTNVGGDSVFQAELWAGSYNRFNTEGFLKQVEVAVWEYPDDVSVLVKEEHEDRFTKYDLSDGFQTDHLSIGELLLALERKLVIYTTTELWVIAVWGEENTDDTTMFYIGQERTIESLSDELRRMLKEGIVTSSTICKTTTGETLTHGFIDDYLA